jgi:hypothetical protein
VTQSPPAAPLPPSLPEPTCLQKPGYVQAIAIMCLVDGILNILWGGGLALTFTLGLVTVCCAPLGLYPVVLGIFEIVYATQILPDPIRAAKPARYLAIMQIINIISGDLISLAVGIISLVFYNDPRVQAYFDRCAPRTASR